MPSSSAVTTVTENEAGLPPTLLHKRVLAAASLSVGAFALTYALVGPVLTSVMEAFGMDDAAGGFISGVMQFGFFASALTGGYFADKLGMRRLMLLSTGMLSVGAFLCAISPNSVVLVAGLIAVGLGAGIVEGVGSALVNHVFEEKSAPALNFVQAVFGVGALTAPVLGALVLRFADGWRLGFGLCAAVSLVATLCQFILPRKTDGDHRLDLSIVKQLASDGGFLLLCLTLFLYVCGEMGCASWVSAFVEREQGLPKSLAALTATLFWGGMLLGRIAYLRLTMTVKLTVLLKICALLAMGFIGAGIAAPEGWQSMALFGLGGMALSGLWPTIVAVGGQWYAKYGATGTGVLVAIGGLGVITMPYLIGLLSESLGLRTAMYFDLPALLAVAALMHWFEKKHKAQARAALAEVPL